MSQVVDLDNASDWTAHVLESRVPVLVDFWHDACHWCHAQDPELRELAEDYSGSVKFVRLNIFGSEMNRAIAQHYQVMAAPFLLLFCNGQAVSTLIGYRPKARLKEDLDKMLSTNGRCRR